ncbi:non-ribosomal peptide synthetase [Chryseobacterium fistulae]|uniref:Tyrocidine synthase 3 n=1 Tax=Chryseobacterium fistulae TaxID=2675058 RepID=A0A6N4XSM5_9FLAO|nr:non-ribosomal peptide synthetase [Chryseobacterium fistulae]CAA7392461.1 Tyrocidine synthase 3 [Chryseobacterium fistulae]
MKKFQLLVKLTPYQESFYNEWMLNPSRNDYNIVLDQSMSGVLDIDRLNSSLVRFINNNLLINSNVLNTSNELVWKRRPLLSEDAPLLTFFSKEPSPEQLLSLALQPFDLENDQLMRFYAIKLDEGKYRIIYVCSHILADGLSGNAFYDEMSNYYNDSAYVSSVNLTEQSHLHQELNHQFDQILNNGKKEMSDFWEEHLRAIENIGFKFLQTSGKSRKKSNSISSISEVRFEFTQDIFFKVKELATSYKLTPYNFGQLIFAIVLHRVSGVENLGVNYPVGIKEGRSFTFGAHVNTIIKGYHFTSETRLSDLIDQNQKYVTELKNTKAHYLPIGKLIKYAQQSDILEFSFAQTNLKDMYIHYEGTSDIVINNELNIDLPGKIVFEQETKEDQLNYRIKYDNFELDDDLVSQFINIYRSLFIRVLDDLSDHKIESKVSSYDLLNKDSYQVVVHDWNATIDEYDRNATLHELFEQQVEKNPDHIALVYGEARLTYRELNERSNRLAHYLLDAHQIQPDELVSLCLDRSEHLLIGILGVLKAGGAYVPMDPGYPMDRIQHILGDTKARVVIVEESTKDRLYEYISLRYVEEGSLNVISLNASEMKDTLSNCSTENPKTNVSSDNLSYVIYTSGTTGKPKGVMIEHRGVINLVGCMISSHRLKDYINVGCYSNYVFDAFVYEAFPVLCHGNTLWLYSNELRKSVKELNGYIKDNAIDVSFIPPVLLTEILPATSLRLIFTGGEAFPDIDRKEYQDIILINEYGPTESTVCATYHHYHEGGNPLNIGRPIANTTTYVLDAYLCPVPIGAVGELYIGGVGLSRGYLNLPELTAERFLINPFQSKEEAESCYNSHIYKTGDLVRYLPGGDIEYVGRNDFQVKIRGYRIELGEIENALLSYEGIRQSVALAKEHSSGLKYLVGYYVSDTEVSHEDLSVYLSGLLPEYMVPSTYVHLKALPITINGKLDRRALPEPSFTGGREYIAPTTVLEKQLAEIYGEVLGLPVENIGLYDDFFRLGGDSIMAIKLISKIYQGLGLKATVAMVFSHKTICGLAGVLQGLELEGNEMIRPIGVIHPEDQRLSFAQERLWFIDQYEGSSHAYNIPMVFRLSGDIDMGVLQDTFNVLLSRHEILRTLILTSSEGVGYQYVSDKELNIREIDVANFEELEKFLSREANRIFDLSQDLPVSIQVLHNRNDTGSSYVSIVIHHIAFDGWSTDIFLEELRVIYQDLLSGSLISLPSLPIQYKDFALWQRDYLQGKVLETQLDYWKSELSGVEPLNLPLDYVRPSSISYEGNTIGFSLPSSLVSDLRFVSRDLGVSLYSVMLGGYYLLLSSYSGQKDIVLGTAVANRHHSGLEDLIGFFINTLVLREEIDFRIGVKDFILQISDSVLEAQKHQDVPFEKLIEELGVVQDVSRHPLFQVMFGLQSFGGEAKKLYDEGNLFQSFEGSVSYDVAKFDLTVMIDDNGEDLSGSFNYAIRLFKESTIDHMISTYVYLLEQIVTHIKFHEPQFLLSELSLVREEECKADGILSNLLNIYSEYDTRVTLHELFERQVERTPDDIALVYEDVKLTYRELNERSNQLAHYLLQNYKINPDELIPLFLERSEQMLIGILGVLKSGGAYVPMDPGYPMDRIEHILGDTKARLVLVEENTKDRLYDYKKLIDTEEASLSLNIISLNSLDMKDSLSACSTENPKTQVSSENLSYVIYTSGTTGKPKGVMIEHKSVVNLLDSIREVYDFSTRGKMSAYTSYVFDVSVSEFFSSLLYGNELHLLSEDIKRDSDSISDYLLDHEITHTYLPPALLSVLPRKVYPCLQTILYAGEPCDEETGRYWGAYKRLYNLYGPTESTIYATYKEIKEGEVHLIGRAGTNTTTYILDEYLRRVPVGAVGELYIGGVGLSRGYLNLPELTSERFLLNPFQEEEEKAIGYNGRMYKTGDLVRYLANGDIEYIGRNDFQVKIRGYRIELGEIESRLLSYEGIRQAVVLAKEHSSGLKYLVGYYVSDTEVNSEDLSVYLSGLLPEYMVPSTYVHLESLPLTINGKLDRKALPEPNFTGDKEYIAPTTSLEKQLAEIYGEVLGLPAESIGLHDDFFRLGGNSIMAIKLISKIHQGLGLKVSVAMVFSHKTIFGLAGVLKVLESGNSEMIRPIKVNRPEDQRLSFAQERLWFIDQYEGGSHVYNIPMVFGLSSKVDFSILEESFKVLLSRHEILRTLIVTSSEGVGYQYVSNQELSIKETNVTSSIELEESLSREITKVFDLSKDLPISVHVFHEKEKKPKKNDNKIISYISIVIHHIAFDGWSIDIFLEELRVIYQDLLLGSVVSLPVLPIQYKDFALWQRDYLQGEVLDKQLDYWKTKLSGVEPLNLALDYVRPSVISYEGHTIRFSIPTTLGEELRFLSRDLGVSLYNVMLGGYYLLLSSYSGQKDIVLGTAVANRHHTGLEDLIGFFVNTLVLREEIDYGVSVRDFILQVSDSVSQAQVHQDVPFEKLVEELGVEQDVSRHPIFQVMFGLQSFGSEAKRMYGEDSLFEEFKGNVSYDVAKFDLSVMIDDGGDSLSGSFNYARGLFKESTIDHMIRTYVYLLEQMVSHHKDNRPELKLEELCWIREEEYKLSGILDTYSEYDMTVTIHELFERQVEKTPDDIALVYEDVRLTYRELNERSNQLAHYLLQNYQIQSDELIPLFLERSEDMLIGILGVLKSGGAYVPMDPSYPMDRIEHILGDTKARLVIVEENTKDRLYDYKKLIDTEEPSNLSIISLNSSDMKDLLSSCSTENLNTEVSPEDLSYVIYTSGTTGKPKGVMIEHSGAVNLVSDLYSRYELNSEDVILQFANYVFDASVEQMFLALLHGNALVLIKDKSYLNEELFLKTLSDHKVSYMHFTPSVLKGMDVTKVKSLRILNSGGEHLADDLYEDLQNKHFRLVNSYGPTETTVTSIVNTGNGFNNIGRAIANTVTYVLDEYLRPVPVGAVGELYIGGAGLSRGYLNLPELTTERFLLNPFQSEEEKEIGYNGRIYKTGDLVRFLSDGNLQYIGRNDFQVKIRGYRIELGEIENGLLSYAGIRQSIVLAKEHSSGLKYLVGYYVSDTEVNSEDLSVYLSGLLPEYMVPSTYVHLESLPLTINGKLDRKALPEPSFTGDKEYIAPTTSLEKQLAEIYGEVLGLPAESIGLHDDFFRLGGDSIISIQLVSRLRKRLSLSLSVKEVFTYRTVYHLSELLESRKDEEGLSLITEQGILEGEVSLLPIQDWFFHEVESGEHFRSFHHWNQSFMIHVPELDIDVLKQSLLQLVEKHDALRLYYPKSLFKFYSITFL